MKSKIIHSLLSISILFSILPINKVYAMTGAGTQANPYIITTCQDLQNMNAKLTSFYKLGNDIDCSDTVNWVNADGHKGFYPVGTLSSPFKGVLEGNFKRISNLYFDSTSSSNLNSQPVGLFGYVEGGTIKDVGLDNVNMKSNGNSGFGAFVGSMHNNSSPNTIQNSFVTGTLNVEGATAYAGSMVGMMDVASDTIQNSYSTVSINNDGGSSSVGGFVGKANSGVITNSYYAGVGNGINNKAFIGVSPTGSYTTNYYDQDINTKPIVSGDTVNGETTTLMKTQSTFAGWDFTNLWVLDSTVNNGYPSLKSFNAGAPAADITPPAEVTALKETHTGTSITLTFTLPTDIDFSYVKVYRNGVLVGNNITTTSFANTALSSSTNSQYKVTTVDKVGNESKGRTFYASTTYLPSDYSAGLIDNENSADNGSLNVTNLANYKDNDDTTFVQMKGISGSTNSYLTFAFTNPQTVNSVFVEYSGEAQPYIVLYDSSYSYLGQVTLTNGLNSIPQLNGVKYIELYSQTGTGLTKLYELELFEPHVYPSTNFSAGHLNNETWANDGKLGVTNSTNLFDDNLSTNARLVGTTTNYSSSYYIFDFSKPQTISSVYINYISNDVPLAVFYDSNYSYLYERYLTNLGDVFKNPVNGVKYIELYGVKNQKNMDINEVEFYGPNITPPDEISNLTTSKTTNSVTLDFQNPLNGDFSGVKIYRDGNLVGNNVTNHTFTDSELDSNHTYNYKITTYDTAGNESLGKTISVTTSSSIPTDVSNLQSSHTINSISLTWDNPTDGNYSSVRIYRDGVKIADNLTGTSFTDSVLNRATNYNYKVVTVNATNESIGKATSVRTDGILSITVPSVNNFPSVPLTSTNNIAATGFAGDLTIEDSSDTGGGWNVTVIASQFSEVGGKGLTLPASSLQLKQPTSITPEAGTSSPNPTVSSEGSWVIDGESAIKLLSANINEGMGIYDITFPSDALQLTVPSTFEVNDYSNSPSGTTYQSVLSFTIVSGP